MQCIDFLNYNRKKASFSINFNKELHQNKVFYIKMMKNAEKKPNSPCLNSELLVFIEKINTFKLNSLKNGINCT